ncbi:hypothetical protein RRF68_02065 [Tenacibaculum sp. HL-MS23]|uniref:hypothetical protein n=1 Tax=Tenacibaculum sp. HL-MS23 TaxID=3077734 RepID=UPI0028FC252E|nr:hypothetical protein [Tenacibaculum sp. HL-MS23]WNW02229.1 hypothetical protein RRF68_02065 [Tenacibaculum sp. HL-MS23]
MMKSYKLIFLFILLPIIMLANDKKHEKSKTISKDFIVNKNATLYINNKYGNINVVTWDENRIEIEVKITVKGNDLSSVDKKLNSINVLFEASKDLVEARTKIETIKSNWLWGNNDNINYKINYFIKMPITNNADLNNKYGAIELDKLKGKANLNCDYGNINVDQLLNDSNTINLDYCGSSEINFIKSGSINIDYSKLKIDKSETLNVNADYSTVKIGNTENLNFNSDYGSISVNDVKNISGSSDYAGISIGTLRKKLKINTEFGGIKVENIMKGFEEIIIDGSYAGIKLGTRKDNNFNFTIDLDYAGFNYPESKVELYKSIKKHTSKYYEGVYGNDNSKSTINIKSKYGGVSLKTKD